LILLNMAGSAPVEDPGSDGGTALPSTSP
jgi:hypothetical protein